MDDLDIKIIKIISNNARISHEEISRILHISRQAIHQRIKKLEGNGVIKGYKSIIDWAELGEGTRAYIYVKVNMSNFKEDIKQYINIVVPNVVIEECQRIHGDWCMVIRIRARSTTDITNFIDQLWKVKSTMDTSATFILSTIIEDGIK
ncbi:Lrp/AsnC family transcriptional regulator [Clostridium botulinum]|uniref:Lrp/AsnC family transcriptional regulator n=1 Tax=Clostridium botulinum TaxID=1491 RepID=A0A6G4EEJ4_CLOBO|nr:Lrp/AsnC family transcriptional regulator [Clostridium botulinum]APH20112.1 asnC-type helix-turn-helix domain protein [Clostridium botulinum]AUM92897.1 transcriptional regulator [Clostridium botulinum]KEI94762.1 transcriptional regulator [Clostridium botulinum F 357]MBE1303279.1 Lrp/AsnC family transcriptional regulator [Clostridium botulinum]NFB14558.1 Lrp/AsnC family transcriptional regulator [Clostridium botulinum]